MARRKVEKKEPERFTREEFETFKGLDRYERSLLRKDEPSCFNGNVCVERYRWTVERIEEDPEVLYARLLDLWERCDNIHHWGPLQATAKRLTGRELPRDRVGKRRGEKSAEK